MSSLAASASTTSSSTARGGIDAAATAQAALADALRDARGALTADAVAELYRRHPEWTARWGAYGRELTTRDTAFHLEFLEAALRGDDDGVFTRYSAWLACVLRSRNVPVEAARESYDVLAALLEARLGANERVARALRRGREALDAPAPVPGRLLDELPPRAQELVGALLAADRRRAQELLVEELQEGRGIPGLADDLVQPTMAELGRLWQENKVSVAQEHLATAIMQTALARAVATTAYGAPSGRRALFACVEGNLHGLGLRVVADAFEHAGWDARYLGADVPSRDLVAAAGEWAPQLVGLSLALPGHVATARRVIEQLRPALPADARIIVGGVPLNDFPGLATVVGADEWFPNATSSVGARA